MKMRDSLRRLLKRHSVEQRNPDTDEPFKLASGGESWLYIDVRKTVLLPHGLYATGMILMDAFLTDESDEEMTVGAIAGPAIGAIPLASSMMLAVYAQDQEAAPSMVLVRKEAKGHGTGKLVEGVNHLAEGTGILVVEDVVTTGGSTCQTINALRDAGLDPLLVIALVDQGIGGLEAIKTATGVRATAVFTAEDLTEFRVDDHVLFLPTPGDDAPEGAYMMLNVKGEWQPCSPEQNEYLHANPEQHTLYEVPEGETLGGAEQFGTVFYVEGVLRP